MRSAVEESGGTPFLGDENTLFMPNAAAIGSRIRIEPAWVVVGRAFIDQEDPYPASARSAGLLMTTRAFIAPFSFPSVYSAASISESAESTPAEELVPPPLASSQRPGYTAGCWRAVRVVVRSLLACEGVRNSRSDSSSCRLRSSHIAWRSLSNGSP